MKPTPETAAKPRARVYILAYDIADPKRLGRVHRYLRKVGIPIQYSVFLLSAGQRRLTRIRSNLQSIIDHRRDDIRIYPLPQTRLELEQWGRQIFPQGVFLLTNTLASHPLPGLASGEESE